MSATVRPAVKEDLEAAVAMLNEHSRRLHGVDDVTPADLLQYWESPDVELGQDILVAENDDGDRRLRGCRALRRAHLARRARDR